MRFSSLAILGSLLHTVWGQSSPSSTTSSAISTNGLAASNTLQAITTTITSLVPGPSGSSSATSFFTLTLTLNTSLPVNATLNENGTIVGTNSTTANSTAKGPWKEGDDWIPFHIEIDPAYGVLGALLMLSGIPVAGLGGKNRWSSLAIVSGYALMLFTLVIILRFGVEENLQPPSPNPPSTTLRGLYLLACIISAFIGAGIGIFFFNLAKHFVSAAGGFTFGWFLLETRPGGLITSVVGRWGLLGGFTLVSLLASIAPVMVEPLVLVSTAWIGATAFMLGVDCYTRAGLKEFYVYNLGFHSLFPKLGGKKYPLTQTMIIELGILVAVVLIGVAVQARVLNRLQKRLREAREEEEMRIEVDEVSRAAERFKNVGTELADWEEKHGKGSGVVMESGQSGTLHSLSTTHLPILGREQSSQDTGARSPSLPPIDTHGKALYESFPINSPPLRVDTPTSGYCGTEQLKDDSTPRTPANASPGAYDPELEIKMKLLEEVRKARESIRGSIDELRRQTPTPSLSSRLDPGASRPATPAYSLSGRLQDVESTHLRKHSSTSSYALGAPDFGPRNSIISSRLLDMPHEIPGAVKQPEQSSSSRRRQYSGGSGPMLDSTQSRPMSSAALLSPASPGASPTDWDRYLAERNIIAPPAPVNPYGRGDRTASMIDLTTPQVTRGPSPMSTNRHTRTVSMLDSTLPTSATSYDSLPKTRPHDQARPDNTYAPGTVIGTAFPGSTPRSRPSIPRHSSWMSARSMTYDELSERHRKRISALQMPVTSQMKEEQNLKAAKEKWELQKRAEKAEWERKEKMGPPTDKGRSRAEGKQEVLKSTDEWRRSIDTGLDGFGRPVVNDKAGGERAREQRGSGGVTGRGRDRRRMSWMIN